MGFNIVLIEPEIPMNTGNIGRLSLASGSVLHLVKPFGFEITDARLKRAGLDYWEHLSVHIYQDIDAFYETNKGGNMVYMSSSGEKGYSSIDYRDNMFLVSTDNQPALRSSLASNAETSQNHWILPFGFVAKYIKIHKWLYLTEVLSDF